MDAFIKYALDKGTLPKERIVLKITRDTDIGQYVIFDTTFNEDGDTTNLLRHVFWFPDKAVSKGDTVIVYTKEGNDSEQKTKAGRVSHFFYWGLDHTVWNQEGDGAVLLEIGQWEAKKV